MADDPLDLSGKKDEPDAAKKSGSQGGGGAQTVYTRPDRAERAWERDLRGRLERTLERLSEGLAGRGDNELATIFKEDGAAMIGGVIAIARPLTWLRPVLVTILTVVEPLLAFGRLARVLLRRLGSRRASAWEQAQLRLAEEQPGGEWTDEGAYIPPEPDTEPPSDGLGP